MHIINKLTVRHLCLNPARTMMTLIGIVLSAAMLTAAAGSAVSLRDGLRQATVDRTGDFHLMMRSQEAETAERIGQNEMFVTYYVRENNYGEYYGSATEDGRVNLYLKLAKPWKEYGEGLNAAVRAATGEEEIHIGYSVNTSLLTLDGGVLAGEGVSLLLLAALGLLIGLIAACTVAVIASAFRISAAERVRQFGLLKSAGATSAQIGRSVLLEAFLLFGIAIVPGILLGIGLQAAIVAVTNHYAQRISLSVSFTPWAILAAALLSALTIFISARKPARRAAKTPAIDAIRQSKDVYVRGRECRGSHLTGRLFGFEGLLAAKSLKRSRRRHRAAVASLAACITLLIALSTVISCVYALVEEHYGKQSSTGVRIDVKGSPDFLDEADAALRSIPGAELKTLKRLEGIFAAGLPYTETYAGLMFMNSEDELYGMSFIDVAALPDEEFARLAPPVSEGIAAILVNIPQRVTADGTPHEGVSPYEFSYGDSVALKYTDGMWSSEWVYTEDFRVTLTAELRSAERLSLPWPPQLLISESDFRAVRREGRTSHQYTVDTDDPDAFCERAEALFGGRGGLEITNHAAEARQAHNYILLSSLFGYGFILLLGLISVTGVIAAISTGMALRGREFAMLYSVGMTDAGMKRMLRLESLLYTLKSLAVGLPLGLGLSYAVYSLLKADVQRLGYRIPWPAVLIAAVTVMLVSFGTMRYSRRKLKRVSIVEALRSESA